MKFNFFNNIFGNKNKQYSEPSGYVYPPGSINGGGIFDGEQDIAAMSNMLIYDVDYYIMAQRAYTLITVNEFARIAVTRLTQFAIGTGLKLHPEPQKRFIERNFREKLPDDFAKNIQELWNLFEEDKNVSSDKLDNIHSIAKSVFYNAYVAGDVLVIKRIKDGNLEYQIVNGLSVKNITCKPSKDGNKIIDGVEIDKSGQHVIYYVVDEKTGKETKIQARDSKGRLLAWLVYADDKRLGAVRGYSPLGAIMQKLHKIGQYSNAEVIAAETNARFAAVIEQDKDSSGINPLKGLPAFARGIQEQAVSAIADGQAAETIQSKKFLENIKRIASGMFFHMPKGQKMSSFDTKRPNVNYAQFVDASMKYNFAAIGIPHEIGMLVFQSNFSASRAALKLFEMILRYYQKYIIVDGFYQEVYKQFFEIGCLKGYIQAPKYLALKNDSGYLDNAYTKAKFIGPQIPHIDETKEVNAVLSKLKGGLTSFEQALEMLGNMTDFDTLIETRKAEEEKIRDAGLDFETILTPEINIINNNNEGD